MPTHSREPGPEDIPFPDMPVIEGMEVADSEQRNTDNYEGLSLEELVDAVAEQRRKSAAEHQVADVASDEKNHPRRGGAFGGALKRRILLTDSQKMRSFTNESDIALVTPENIKDRIFPSTRVEQSFNGVLLTAEEYSAVTVSAPELARRLGANVMKHTTERSPSERHRRREIVVSKALAQRNEAVSKEIERLVDVSDKLATLKKEIRTPGYAHMSLAEMNELMRNAETVFLSMFEAIVESDDNLDNDRVYSLSGALMHNLTSDDYKATFELWKSMTNLAFNWTNRKIVSFIEVKQGIEARASQTQ